MLNAGTDNKARTLVVRQLKKLMSWLLSFAGCNWNNCDLKLITPSFGMTWTVPLSPFLWTGRFPNSLVYSLTIYNSKSVKGFLSFLAHQSLHFLLLFLDIWLFYRKGTLNTPLQKISRIGRFIQRGNYHKSFKVNKGEGWEKQSLGVSHLPIIKKTTVTPPVRVRYQCGPKSYKIQHGALVKRFYISGTSNCFAIKQFALILIPWKTTGLDLFSSA